MPISRGQGSSRRRLVQALRLHLIGTPTPRCPFADNAAASPEALVREPAPEFGAIAAALRPFGIQHRQVNL
jgi:hypothetical protein